MRFCDELGRRDYVTGEMWKNGKFPIRLVLNGQASKEIEWCVPLSFPLDSCAWVLIVPPRSPALRHCKHYCGRGLMKRFESGADLAKEMGIKPEVLKKTCQSRSLARLTGSARRS